MLGVSAILGKTIFHHFPLGFSSSMSSSFVFSSRRRPHYNKVIFRLKKVCARGKVSVEVLRETFVTNSITETALNPIYIKKIELQENGINTTQSLGRRQHAVVAAPDHCVEHLRRLALCSGTYFYTFVRVMMTSTTTVIIATTCCDNYP